MRTGQPVEQHNAVCLEACNLTGAGVKKVASIGMDGEQVLPRFVFGDDRDTFLVNNVVRRSAVVHGGVARYVNRSGKMAARGSPLRLPAGPDL